ncbi:hypothetical protein [Bacillus wiedmannii]|uniref:Cthe-2314-like HEPN domain-containing protein n=1 Tax=Bacillus wiedmannii TaxID=1890302 RepID=A0A242Z0S2_9BACI|nr:hypothetical protein [Bacillus wiedmannii]MED3126823.1 hypothetical protein [Bacillus wiedmannii]OTX86030.1 hypothetical protein BK730_21865 [Bacillus wiedmannii]
MKDKPVLNTIMSPLKEIGDAISSGKLKVEKINLFLDLKYNLEEKIKCIQVLSNEFYKKEKEEEINKYNLVSFLSFFLESSTNSFLAPAYHLNSYLNNLNDYNVRVLNKENLENVQTLIVNFSIDIQSIFYSIKGLMDRLIPVMSFFYSGISLESTFGRINPETNKAKGLMSKVSELKDNCEIMYFIYEQYDEWIRDIVLPRDLITHYNDLGFRSHYTVDGRLIPFHIERKIFKDPTMFPNEYTYKDIVKAVNQTYYFVETVLNNLLHKEFKLSKQHFREVEDYKIYREIRQ